MDLNSTVRNLRQQFGAELDKALAEEVRRRKLEEADLQALAEVLPEVIVPQLSPADEKKALKIKDDLDKKVEKMAELTAQICQVADDYHKQTGELRGLLAGKKNNVNVGHHSGSRLTYMLKILSKILENDATNAVAGFRTLPDQDYVQRKISNYNGL